MRIFFDLDGPLLDVAERYYHVHKGIVAGQAVASLSLEEFWELKRRQASIEELLAGAGPELSPARYRQAWLESIEEPAALAHDRLVPGALSVLQVLASHHELFLVTLRRDGGTLQWQLDRLGLGSYFLRILWGQTNGEEGWRSKVKRIQAAGLAQGPAAIVGDTEVDVRAGKELGMVTIATANGIRTAEFLAHVAGADIVIPDIKALLPALEALQAQGILA